MLSWVVAVIAAKAVGHNTDKKYDFWYMWCPIADGEAVVSSYSDSKKARETSSQQPAMLLWRAVLEHLPPWLLHCSSSLSVSLGGALSWSLNSSLRLLFPYACSVCNYSTACCFTCHVRNYSIAYCFQNCCSELHTAVTSSLSGANCAACAPCISYSSLRELKRTPVNVRFVSFLWVTI